MNEADFDKSRTEAVRLAKAILAGDIGIIEGVRRILRSIAFLPEYEDSMFLPIRSVESQTDDIPLGAEREKVPSDILEDLDKQMSEFLPLVHDTLMETCRKIIERYESTENDAT